MTAGEGPHFGAQSRMHLWQPWPDASADLDTSRLTWYLRCLLGIAHTRRNAGNAVFGVWRHFLFGSFIVFPEAWTRGMEIRP